MVLTTGTRLGPYEVIAQIGAGGMGEVYKATDTNLKRAVAIKVLPAAFAADAERLTRFQREAEVLASLNHPNIAAIYGLERSGSTTALVMELVVGPTLADRIAQEPVPVDEALRIAMQIAEALEAAHEQGIIHRDLKPANVKVRPDGTVKVLDFGLAKSIDAAAAVAANLSMLPTLTSPAMTHAGVIIGTAAYMSPEQARGTMVDESSDVWAFGVVLWEMLTGRRLFEGATVSDTLASILKTDPDWRTLGPAVPPAIRTLLRRCLQKDRKARLDSARAARLEIEDALSAPTPDASGTTRPAAPHRWTRALPWVLVPIGVLAGIIVASLNPPRDTHLQGITQFQIPAPDDGKFGDILALSPDGRTVAFQSGGRLWIRSMDAVEPRALPGLERATNPFWSPDSRSLGFFQDRKLKIIDVAGGVPRLLCELTGAGFNGASWSHEGVILFSSAGRLWRVPAVGGQPAALDPAGASDDQWPVFLPDGRHFLFLMRREPDAGIHVGSLDRSLHQQESAPLLSFEPDARPGNFSYIPSSDGKSGYLLFMPENTLLARLFDVNAMKLSGEAFPVVDGVAAGGAGVGAFSTSANGTLAYRSGVDIRQMTWFNRKGDRVDSTAQLTSALTLSPDGHRAIAELNGALWLWEFGAEVRKTVLIANPPGGRNPVWSRDGSQIAFARDGNLYRMPSGGGKEEILLEGSPQKKAFAIDWSADGRFLLYSTYDPRTNRDLWALPLTGDRTPRPVANSESNESRGQFSPDGRWIAYTSNKSGSSEIYVQAFSSTSSPSGDAPIVVSTNGGDQPRWRRDGRELFYRTNRAGFYAVAVDTRQAFRRDNVPTLLFPAPAGPGPGDNNSYYDVTADGERFLVNTFPPGNLTAPLTVIVNWTSSLKQ